MLYREIIAVCSEIHVKHVNTRCGQHVVLLSVKLVVHTGLQRVKNFLFTVSSRFSRVHVGVLHDDKEWTSANI
jgi:hypothetical protein